MTLLVVAMYAQLADLVTYRPELEANPIAIALGPDVPPMKALLLAFVPAVWMLLRLRGRYPVVRAFLVAELLVAGLIGASSNLLSA